MWHFNFQSRSTRPQKLGFSAKACVSQVCRRRRSADTLETLVVVLLLISNLTRSWLRFIHNFMKPSEFFCWFGGKPSLVRPTGELCELLEGLSDFRMWHEIFIAEIYDIACFGATLLSHSQVNWFPSSSWLWRTRASWRYWRFPLSDITRSASRWRPAMSAQRRERWWFVWCAGASLGSSRGMTFRSFKGRLLESNLRSCLIRLSREKKEMWR